MAASWSAARFLRAALAGGAPARASEGALEIAGETLRTRTCDPPRGAARGTVLVVHGMSLRGIEDPRITAISQAFAAAGYRAVAPELPGAARLRVEAADIDRIEAGAAALAGDGRVGMFSASFSAAMCLVAAARLGERVSAVCAVGTFGDARAALEHVMAAPEADPYGRMVICRNFIRRGIGENARVEEAMDAWLADASLRRDPPEFPGVAAGLGEADRALVEGLVGGPVSGELAARMLAGTEELMAALDVRAVAERVRADVTLIHGAGDAVIPPEASVDLATRLPRARACVTPLLSHGDTRYGLRDVGEVLRLFRAFRAYFLALG